MLLNGMGHIMMLGLGKCLGIRFVMINVKVGWVLEISPSGMKEDLWSRWVHLVKNELCENMQSLAWLRQPVYNIKMLYKKLNTTHIPNVCRYVWNRYSLPKHRFILWLSIQEKLQVKERLWRMGISVDTACYLCEGELKIMLIFLSMSLC
ncbi:hypothetical protein RDABS01_009663 [Bienertia sinuspersici]